MLHGILSSVLYSLVRLLQLTPLYSCKNFWISWESLTPLLLYRFIPVRKALSSSYSPRSLPSFSAINAPIFSKLASSSVHDGCESLRLQRLRTSWIRLQRNLNKVDFPEPVGMPTASHIMTGSFQRVPTQLTSECESMKLTTDISPNSTAVAGTLNVFPITEHPCNKVMSVFKVPQPAS